jgi:hypothetical protein
MQMAAAGYISDTEVIVKSSWSNIQHHGFAAFKSSERSPGPPALSVSDFPPGQTRILNVCQIKPMEHYPAISDEESSPESISDTRNWLNWNEAFDNSNNSEADWETGNEADLDLANGSEKSETPQQRNLSAAPTVRGLVWPIQLLKKRVENALMTVNIVQARRTVVIKKQWDRLCQFSITKFIRQFD